jgi:hypothetical protein
MDRRAPSAAPDRRASSGLLDAILEDPGRDRCSGARPVVSVREQEDPAFLATVDARRISAASLSRRGTWHGEWAELPDGDAALDLATALERWHAARPIVLRGAASAEDREAFADEIAARGELHAALQEKRGLRTFLESRAGDLATDFEPARAALRLFDPERDLERVAVASLRGRRVDDLWVKSAWLSTSEGDDSLRVRVSFGKEREDDASGDLLRHRLVADLAARLFPESALVAANPAIAQLVERLLAGPALFTQHIAYWNAPDGGALFHHDAFAEDEEEPSRPGQLGVAYLQITGRTAWLALSIQDLARRVREFVECLLEGELPWVAAQLFPDGSARKRAAGFAADPEACLAELAKPGCGALASLVNRGPEFTAWLADAGHAVLLSPGDAILLPNHGLRRTAMHSVFCAGDEVAYALSLAIRSDREPEPAPSFSPPRRRRRP